MQAVSGFLAGVVALVSGWFGTPIVQHPPTKILKTSEVFTDLADADALPHGDAGDENATTTDSGVEAQEPRKEYTHADLLAMADDKYASGVLPLGDMNFVTKGPKKGYIYLCRPMSDRGGAMMDGPWIHGNVWDIDEKISVSGSVSWPKATFKNSLSGESRLLTGNGLPLGHTTGKFPIAESDKAYQYDRNPNSIKTQTLSYKLPAKPEYSDTPYCMGGESGIMLTGIPIFNGFDAGMRDAAAHEVQDSCEGHPQVSGEYHYHSLSSCMKDISVSTVLGYALDGFPITGPLVEKERYLTTEDLDECHGITSEVKIGGKNVMTYHYVMTQDFPYSVSCFRGKPSTMGPSGVGMPQMPLGTMPMQGGMQMPGMMPPGGGMPMPPLGGPPPEALSACTGKKDGAACSFKTPFVQVSGQCHTTPDKKFACVPR